MTQLSQKKENGSKMFKFKTGRLTEHKNKNKQKFFQKKMNKYFNIYIFLL